MIWIPLTLASLILIFIAASILVKAPPPHEEIDLTSFDVKDAREWVRTAPEPNAFSGFVAGRKSCSCRWTIKEPSKSTRIRRFSSVRSSSDAFHYDPISKTITVKEPGTYQIKVE